MTGDRVALVTGASSGIGAATARLLASRGMRVVVNYLHNAQAAADVVADIEKAGGTAAAVQADVRDPAAVEAMTECVQNTWGGVDVLVHNALTPYAIKSFQDMTWPELGGKLDDELKAAYVVTKAVLPHMTEHGGRIIFIGTGLSRRPRAGMIALGTAKAALAQFARYLAQELGPLGITVNVVEPGPVAETRISAQVFDDDLTKRQVAATPMGRLALPKDVAQAVAFYASADNTFMTGTTAAVNGGMAMH
jgi:3-oxoacyl-[acyl-carrier protein] reductase